MARIEQSRQERDPVKEQFSGKSVIITGAAAGIGDALAKRLHNIADLKLLDIKPTIASSLTTERFYANVTDLGLLRGVRASLAGEKIDLLVHAAGITQSKTGKVSKKETATIMAVNSEGTRNIFETFQDSIKPGGTVVVISSDRAFRAEDPVLPAYTESKKRILKNALEFASKRADLRVVVLVPGPVDTNLFRKNKSEQVLSEIEKTEGIYNPSEFAEEVLGIIADKESYPSGSVIRMYKKAGISKVPQEELAQFTS